VRAHPFSGLLSGIVAPIAVSCGLFLAQSAMADDAFTADLPALSRPYTTCIHAQSIMLDDAVTDAETIGSAVMRTCKPLLRTVKSATLELPQLTPAQRQHATQYFDGLEAELQRTGAAGIKVLQNRKRTRGVDQKDVDAVWTAFRPYFSCLEDGFNALDQQDNVMLDLMVIMSAVGEEKVCYDRFSTIQDDFVVEHASWDKSSLTAFLGYVPVIAAVDAMLDRIAGNQIAIP
jgi:hypothetical protein